MDYLIKQKPYVNAYPPKQEIKITGHIIFEFLHHVEWPKKNKNRFKVNNYFFMLLQTHFIFFNKNNII